MVGHLTSKHADKMFQGAVMHIISTAGAWNLSTDCSNDTDLFSATCNLETFIKVEGRGVRHVGHTAMETTFLRINAIGESSANE